MSGQPRTTSRPIPAPAEPTSLPPRVDVFSTERMQRRAHALHAAVAHHRLAAAVASREDVAETFRFFLSLLAEDDR